MRAAIDTSVAFVVMAGRLYRLALRNGLAADGADLVTGVACLGAGRLDRAAYLCLVAESTYIIFNITVTTLTDICGVALFRACRRGYNGCVAVGVIVVMNSCIG